MSQKRPVSINVSATTPIILHLLRLLRSPVAAPTLPSFSGSNGLHIQEAREGLRLFGNIVHNGNKTQPKQ